MRCVLFDLDGVLVDTRSLVASALTHVAQELDIPIHSDAQILRAASLPPRRAVKSLFPGQSSALALFQRKIDSAVRELAPCAGVTGLIRCLDEERLGVVTSRNRHNAQLYLTQSGLRPYFHDIVTWGDTSRHKPDPDPLVAAAARLGVVGGLYIGDTPDDMVAAVAGGFDAIGALWASAWSAADLLQAGASFAANEPQQIIAHLEERRHRHGR